MEFTTRQEKDSGWERPLEPVEDTYEAVETLLDYSDSISFNEVYSMVQDVASGQKEVQDVLDEMVQEERASKLLVRGKDHLEMHYSR